MAVARLIAADTFIYDNFFFTVFENSSRALRTFSWANLQDHHDENIGIVYFLFSLGNNGWPTHKGS